MHGVLVGFGGALMFNSMSMALCLLGRVVEFLVSLGVDQCSVVERLFCFPCLRFGRSRVAASTAPRPTPYLPVGRSASVLG